MKKFIAALIAALVAGTLIASPTHADTTSTLASVTQTALSATSMGSGTKIRTVKALSNGQTVNTYRYATVNPDEVGDVWFDTDWLPGAARPAVIIVHGGWWHNGTRASEDAASQRFLDAGFVVFNIDYRVAAVHQGYAGSGSEGTTLPGSRWPDQRVDAAMAYDWLKVNAGQFNVDPTRVAIYGSSAGGHIAHIASGLYGKSKFRASVSVGGVMQPTRVAEIVMRGTYGGVDSTSTYAKSFGYMTSALGCSYEPTWYDCGNRWKSFKPDALFGADKPPVYIVKGEDDPVEPTAETVTSVKYWLNYYGQDGTVVTAANRGHEETALIGTSNSEDIARWNAMITWLRARTA